MKVVKAKGSDSETYSEIDLGDIPKELRPEVQTAVGEYLIEQILQTVTSARSPVSGESFPQLSKDYKKEKIADGLPGKANLENTGSMLDALTYQPATGSKIRIGFFGSEAGKADGHNNLSGNSDLPQRRFLPDAGQEFIGRIQSEVEQIIADTLATNDFVTVSDLADVETSADLYDVLRGALGEEFTRSQLRNAVLANESVLSLLTELGLEDLL